MKPTNVGLNLVFERVGLGQEKKTDDTCVDTEERKLGGYTEK